MKTLIALLLVTISTICVADVPMYTIGVILPLTGNFANYGDSVRHGIEKANVPNIQWIFEDEACESGKAITAFKKLSSVDKLPFIIGPCCGSPQKAVAPLLNNQKHIVLLPNAAPREVFSTSGKRMYSVQYSLEAEGAFLAEEMNKRGLKKAAIILVDNDFSRTVETGFLKVFKGEVVYSLHAPGFDGQYMKGAALNLKTLDFDSLFIPDASPFLLGFLTELKKLNISQRPAFANYSAQMPDVLAGEKGNADGLFYAYPDVPDTEDAFGYFPALAARILGETVTKCHGEYECVAKSFERDTRFQTDGTLEGRIVLKQIREGQFVRVIEP